jgi:hypothetical protein
MRREQGARLMQKAYHFRRARAKSIEKTARSDLALLEMTDGSNCLCLQAGFQNGLKTRFDRLKYCPTSWAVTARCLEKAERMARSSQK